MSWSEKRRGRLAAYLGALAWFGATIGVYNFPNSKAVSGSAGAFAGLALGLFTLFLVRLVDHDYPPVSK